MNLPLSQLLNALQKSALRTVATEEGRNWKARLRTMWEKAEYPGYEQFASTLQYLRNARYFGPKGLIKVRTDDFS
jgi:hypothetical protein